MGLERLMEKVVSLLLLPNQGRFAGEKLIWPYLLISVCKGVNFIGERDLPKFPIYRRWRKGKAGLVVIQEARWPTQVIHLVTECDKGNLSLLFHLRFHL